MNLALIGGEEFSDGFEDVHASLLEDARRELRRTSEMRRNFTIAFLPTCAADDGVQAVDYWCNTAREKLGALGAMVETPRVVDAASANDAHHAQIIADADWIYLGGGYPHVGMNILPGTRAMDAIRAAAKRGALISGASAGAMLMCERSWVITPEMSKSIGEFWETGVPESWEPPELVPLDCLGLVPRAVCSPHFNRVFSRKWLERGILPKGFALIGLDEQTALVSHDGKTWDVRGRGAATIIRDDFKSARYAAGETLDFRSLRNFGSLVRRGTNA
jgi:cyanophycinase-like exopeptidase